MTAFFLVPQAVSVGASGVSDVDPVGEWWSAADGGTPTPLSWQAAESGSLDHLDGGGPLPIMLARTADRTPTPRRCDCADWLKSVAEEHANNSRDFGRGFMHAARELERRCV